MRVNFILINAVTRDDPLLLTKMVFLINIILVIKILHTFVTTAEVKCSTEYRPVNEVSGDVFHSFKSFAAKMKIFLHSAVEDVNQKRIKYKKILHYVVKDIQSEKNLKNSVTPSSNIGSKFITGDKHNVKRYLADNMEVSVSKELPLEKGKVVHSTYEPFLEDFLQYIDKFSAYNNLNITSKDIIDSKPILKVLKSSDKPKATASQAVNPDIVPLANTKKFIPKKQYNCRFKTVLRSIIKMLQDNKNEIFMDSTPVDFNFDHFESNTVPYEMNFLKKKPYKTKFIQQIIHECLEYIFNDISDFIKTKMNKKLKNCQTLQHKFKNDRRHFEDQKDELIQDVFHYLNKKYFEDENSTTKNEEEYVQVSSTTRYSVASTEFYQNFRPTPKVFQYFIKKISKSNSYTKIDHSLHTESSTENAILSSYDQINGNGAEKLFKEYKNPQAKENTNNLQLQGNCTISKLLSLIKKTKETIDSTIIPPISQLELNNLRSTAPSQSGQTISEVFLKFINLYSKKNETLVKSATSATTAHSTEAFSVVMKRPLPLVFSHGYKVALHHIETVDGYTLTVHRLLPHHKVRSIAKRKNRIALLHHGLLGSADDWVLLGPNKSLPYLLTDIGYDVWLANARGNKYSHFPSKRRVNVSDYWNFSFHEIGLYDLSVVIDHIRLKTKGSSRIDFIGHSMGATALLVLLSTSPQYNFLLRFAILLAPLAYMYRSQGLLRLLSEYQTKKGYKSLYFLGETEFMPSHAFPNKVTKLYCKGDRISCLNPWLLIANGGLNMQNKTLEKIILEHVPAGGSTKTIVHYTQLVRSGQFQLFDLGLEGNTLRYGTRAPPPYRLNDVTIPVAIFSSHDDLLSTSMDIDNLISNLPNFIGHHIVGKHKFTHTDFVFSEDAPDAIYYRIIKLLDHGK